MSLGGILFYTGRAAQFALVISLIYAAGRAILLAYRGQRLAWRREILRFIFAFYLAALIEIIALRGGPGSQRSLQLVPLKTTLAELKGGAWAFIYHTVGNCAWFVPLGMFLWRRGAVQAFATGAVLSAILEAGQWILKTGMTDVDDILLNALGALAGWCLIKLWKKCLNKARLYRV